MTRLEEFLSRKDFRTILAIEPGGNHGDTLIYEGMYKLFNRSEVNYQIIPRTARGAPKHFTLSNLWPNVRTIAWRSYFNYKKITSNPDAIYIHGGGAFNDIWWSTVHLFEIVENRCDCPIIIGPQTIRFEDIDPVDFFNDISSKVTFFCREKYSYEIINSIADEIELVDCHLSPDTALYLDKNDVNVDLGEDYTLYAMRDDRESAIQHDQVISNIQENALHKDISNECDSVEEFLSTIAKAQQIHTDRLHVAIGCAILKKPCTLYDNAYYKNRGVYEYSLKNFPNVSFEGSVKS